MVIPEKYRDRYDRLALSHPWMREMRDEQVPDDELIRELRQYAEEPRYDYNPLDDVFEPDERLCELCGKVADMLEARGETNVIDGETNGIADETPLVDEPPEGDAVAILRDSDDGSVRMKAFAYDPHSFTKLADMVERDYVSREDWDEAIRAMKAAQDAMELARDERDVWKTKCETFEFAYKQADAERKRYSEQIDELRAERDELSDKIGEITDEISELMKKQPYTFDVYDVPGSLRTVGRYIDELTAERDELEKQLDTTRDVARNFRDERDELQRELGYYVTAYRRAARERDGLARDLADAMDRGLA